MKKVAVEFTYYTDIIEVPDHIVVSIKKVQRRFDKWIYDKTNDHGCWVIEDGEKVAVAFCTSDFVNYINNHEVDKSIPKVRIVQEELSTTPEGIPSIWF